MAEAPEIRNLKGKLNVLSTVMRLGHEAFQRQGLEALAYHIVNNSRLAIRFDRAAMVDLRFGRPRLTAVMGQAEADGNAEYGMAALRMAGLLSGIREKQVITAAALQEREGAEAEREAFAELGFQTLVAIPMRDPRGGDDPGMFLWLVEFADEPPAGSDHILQLLGETYNDALWSCIYSRRRWGQMLLSGGRVLSPGRVFVLLLVAFVLSLIFSKVSQNVAADFEVVPQEKEVLYAPYDGAIRRVLFPNGAMVKVGAEVMKYDTDELEYRLADAQASFDEISAKLDLVRREAFTDNNRLGEIKLMAIQKEKEKVNIEKMKWYLSRSAIVTTRAGVFVVDDEERWEGRAVRTGDKLAEIFAPGQYLATVLLNEKDASVLGDGMAISLYLHTRPESPLVGKVVAVSPKPLLQKNGQYCYEIKIGLDEGNKVIFGMRGVARISGPRVTLGYYLFRNLVLWWRKL